MATYISRVRLRNWKNFRDAQAALGLRVFLIGPNASGKSNLLDAFRFLHDLTTDGLRKAVDARGGMTSLRALAATGVNKVELEVDVAGLEGAQWTYRLMIQPDHVQRPVVGEEVVIRNGAHLLARPDAQDRSDPLLLTQTALEQIAANQKFRELAAFFGAIAYRNLLPQIVRDPRDFAAHAIQRDSYGRDFLQEVWKTPTRTRNARLRKIATALQSAAPQLDDLTIEVDASSIPHLLSRAAHWRTDAPQQNETHFSDGTLRLIGLLWSALDGDGPLLLEEPENSLHPEVVRRLPSLLFRINQTRKAVRQMLISTHSEELLSDPGIGPEEVLRLEPSSDGTQLRAPDDADRAAMQAGLTAADVLMPQTAPANIQQLVSQF